MNIYSIYFPSLDVDVKIKSLSASETSSFMEDLTLNIDDRYYSNDIDFIPDENSIDDSDFGPSSEATEYSRYYTVSNLVYNFKSEVLPTIRKKFDDDKDKMQAAMRLLYYACINLNPKVDPDIWLGMLSDALLSYPLDVGSIQRQENLFDIISTETSEDDIEQMQQDISSMIRKTKTNAGKSSIYVNAKYIKPIAKQKITTLESHLKNYIIGQDEAIEEVVSALKRSYVGLNDEGAPLGVFLFAGPSGCGKTETANLIHDHLFNLKGDTANKYHILRIDCGEFQQKHENAKLFGAPPGYVGYTEGGQLWNGISKNPNTVILLDEVEKAHPDLFDTLLRPLDDGVITSSGGEKATLKNAVIIMTTNLGNKNVISHIEGSKTGFTNKTIDTKTAPSREMVIRNTKEAIKDHFRAEFLNRIEKVVVFNHLTHQQHKQIAELEIDKTSKKLAKKGYYIELGNNVVEALLDKGIDNIKGARGLSNIRKSDIENKIASLIIDHSPPKGTIFEINYIDNNFEFEMRKPKKKSKRIRNAEETKEKEVLENE